MTNATTSSLRRAPRSTLWIVISALLLVAVALLNPQQLPVVLYKALLISIGGVLGYWLDRALFPYARPDGYLFDDWRFRGSDAEEGDVDFPVVPSHMQPFCWAMLRRSIVVAAVIVAIALGL